MGNGLEEWGKRWNKKTRTDVAFDPSAEELMPDDIPIQIEAVDEILGGGIPRGRTTVLFGESSSGKTLLSQLIIASAQRQGGKAMFFDIERTYDPKWFAITGVDTSPEKLIVVRPRSLEQTFDMVIDALENMHPDVIVVDSIPSMVPDAMLKVEMSDKDFRGLQARKVTEGVRKANHFNQSTALVYINQLRVDMGVSFGNPESMPGGKGLRFWTSLLIRMRRGQWLTDKTENRDDLEDFTSVDEKKNAKRIGFMLKLRVEKTKISSTTFEECELKFFFTGEMDAMGSLINLAIQRGVIGAARGYYEIPGIDKKIHGLGAVEKLLKGDEKLKASIIAKIKEKP